MKHHNGEHRADWKSFILLPGAPVETLLTTSGVIPRLTIDYDCTILFRSIIHYVVQGSPWSDTIVWGVLWLQRIIIHWVIQSPAWLNTMKGFRFDCILYGFSQFKRKKKNCIVYGQHYIIWGHTYTIQSERPMNYNIDGGANEDCIVQDYTTRLYSAGLCNQIVQSSTMQSHRMVYGQGYKITDSPRWSHRCTMIPVQSTMNTLLLL